MTNYKYKARDKSGKSVTGLLEAETEGSVVDNLKKMGYTPVSVEKYTEKKPLFSKSIKLFSRVKEEDMILFTRQMSTLLKSGIPLLSGLDAVGEQTTSTVLKKAILRVKKDIEAGLSFSEALSKHPRVFPSLYISMIKTGEATGLLDSIMERLAELEEYEYDIKTKIKSAVRYPLITVATLIGAFFALVLFVIPRFATLFQQYDMVLPLPTRALLFLYEMLTKRWYIAIIFVAVVVFGVGKFISTNYGRKMWDRLKLKVPVFGPLLLKLYMARFTRTSSILIASGITMLQTLDLAKNVVGNSVISDGIIAIKDGVNEGTGLAAPMKLTKLFTPMVIQMVSIGEETGKLDDLLARASEHYDQQINYTMKNLTTLIEPILLFCLGIMVVVVALAVFLPLWNMVYVYKSG